MLNTPTTSRLETDGNFMFRTSVNFEPRTHTLKQVASNRLLQWLAALHSHCNYIRSTYKTNAIMMTTTATGQSRKSSSSGQDASSVIYLPMVLMGYKYIQEGSGVGVWIWYQREFLCFELSVSLTVREFAGARIES